MQAAAPQSRRHGLALGCARLTWGTALVAAPRGLLRLVGVRSDARSVTVARVLGARHAAQALVELTTWPRWRRLGAGVDAAHAVSALGLAGFDARRRRVGLLDGAVATALAVAGITR